MDRTAALDFAAQDVVIGLQTDVNVMGRQYILQLIFIILNFVASRRYSDDFLAHVKLILSLVDIGNRVESQQFDETQSIIFKR